MKKIVKNIAFSLLGLLIFQSCNEYEAPTGDPSVIFTSTGFGDPNESRTTVQINGTETFADLSRGVTSRTWTFPGGDVTDVSTSSDDLVRATFSQVGDFEVLLEQTFSENPWHAGDSAFRSTNMLDTIFNIHVIDSVDAQVEIVYIDKDKNEGNPLDLTSGVVNELLEGESIRIKNVSLGEPLVFDYLLPNGAPSSLNTLDSAEFIDVRYKDLGEKSMSFNASRAKPFGSDLLELEAFINVVESDRVPCVEQIISEDSISLSVVFNRVMSTPDVADASNFTVNVTNEDAGLTDANNDGFTVTNVQLGSGDDNNVVILTLSQRLYNSDVVTVSYTPGSIQTNNGILLTAFNDFVAVFAQENLVEEFGDFETPALWNTGEILINTLPSEPATFVTGSDAFNGTSLKLSSSGSDSGGDQTASEAAPTDGRIAVEEGQNIRALFWVRFEEIQLPPGMNDRNEWTFWLFSNTDKVKSYDFSNPARENPSVLFEHTLQPEWAPNNPNMWFEIDVTVPVNSSGNALFYFRTIGDVTAYIDDVRLFVVEIRPDVVP